MSQSDKRKRRFARASERIPIRLSYDDGERSFSALVYSQDISVSGVFLASEFFLKSGMELDLEFSVPNDERRIRVRGVIVREVRVSDRVGSAVVSGFAIKFTEYYDDAKTALASSFLIVELDDFVRDYLNRRTKKPFDEIEQLIDVIVAWEVGRMDVHDREFNLLRESIRTDGQGRIARRGGARPQTRIGPSRSDAGASTRGAPKPKPKPKTKSRSTAAKKPVGSKRARVTRPRPKKRSPK